MGAGETTSAYLLIYSFLLPLLSGEDKKLAKNRKYNNNSKRPVDALAEKHILLTHSVTDNLKSRDACASKKYVEKRITILWKDLEAYNCPRVSIYPKEKMLTDM